MNINGQIENKLRQLKLTGILQTLSERVKQAEGSKSGYEEFLMMLLEDEHERRQSGRLLKRLKHAGFEEEPVCTAVTAPLFTRSPEYFQHAMEEIE